MEEEKIEAVNQAPSGKGIWVKAILFQIVLGVPLAYALTLAFSVFNEIGSSGDDAAFLGALLMIYGAPFVLPAGASIACIAGMIAIKFRPKYQSYAKPLRYCLYFWCPIGFLEIALAIVFLIYR